MSLKNNEFVVYLKIEVENIGPLHIGDGEGNILFDTYTNKPYIPATSIAGTIKSYLSQINDNEVVEKYLGRTGKKEDNQVVLLKNKNFEEESRISIFDVLIDEQQIETRPGLRMDGKTGTKVGNAYFNTKYLKRGCRLTLNFEAFIVEEEQEELELQFKQILKGIDSGVVRLGAKKTIGAGTLKIKEAQIAKLNLKNKKSLVDYINRDIDKYYQLYKYEESVYGINTIRFNLECRTQTPLLIKAIGTQNHQEADSRPITNGEGRYIIPGSSIKGVMRSESRKIVALFKQEQLVSDLFGNEANETDKAKYQCGKVLFEDAIIENTKQVKMNRIKIDRFTGGVMSSALMAEEVLQGEIKINVLMQKKTLGELSQEEKKEIALLALMLRDIGMGELKIGSGQGIGRGKLLGSILTISGLEQEIKIDFCDQNRSQYVEVLNGFCNKLSEKVNE